MHIISIDRGHHARIELLGQWTDQIGSLLKKDRFKTRNLAACTKGLINAWRPAD